MTTETQSAADVGFIRKIRGLMAKTTEAGCTEGEAMAAASLVQKLLAERGMAMASIGGAEALTQAEKRTKTPHMRAAMYQFQRDLMAALARNNFCMHFIEEVIKADPRGREVYDATAGAWITGRKVKCHILLGSSVNVEVTKLTYDYLTEAMDRLLPYTGMEKRGREALLWLSGCTERLVERLNARRAEMEAESAAKAKEEAVRTKHPGAASTGNALVVLSDVYGSEEDLNKDALWGYEPGTTARKRRESAARDARREELMKEGWTWTEAYYFVVRGVPREVTAAEEAQHKTAMRLESGKPETPSQRRRREEREYRQSQSYWQRAGRKQRQEENKRSHPAYRAGHSTANDIGLDKQVDEKRGSRIGRK